MRAGRFWEIGQLSYSSLILHPSSLMNGVNMHYDFIIIGTGAGGGTLVHKLAPSGKKILVLERGDFVKRELENWNSRQVNVEGHYNTK